MAFLLRDAKRGTRGGKKLAAAVAGRRSRQSRSSVRPNPFEAAGGRRRWKLSGIRTGDSGRFTKDDGGTALVTKALPLNGEIVGHRFAWARAWATDALSS